MSQAYPLHWPVGWPRTKRPRSSAFRVTFAEAREDLQKELALMGARYLVISTNHTLRRDGLPYANQPTPDDCGVAVYFEWNGKQMSFACDKWDTVRANLRAIGKTVENLRGIERWGASDMMERAFSAFEALPAPKSCWDELEIAPDSDRQTIISAYRYKAKRTHPDHGGSELAMAALNAAKEQALKST